MGTDSEGRNIEADLDFCFGNMTYEYVSVHKGRVVRVALTPVDATKMRLKGVSVFSREFVELFSGSQHAGMVRD
jgi:hypothetical protein